MSEWLHGIHDVDGANLMADRPGWILITEAIGCDPKDTGGIDYSHWRGRGYSTIIRLNNGYQPAGTIPTPDRYQDFAVRCANFVANSPGCEIVVIGNEPNHSVEWPDGKKIGPSDYAHCYFLCRQEIRRRRADVLVLAAGCSPWNNEAGMDWLDYFRIVLANGAPFDGFALHCYTHGSSPDLVFSDEVVAGWHWHFRVYRDQCAAIVAAGLGAAPVYLTESDQNDPWLDSNNGWVKNAYAEIDEWNVFDNPPLIRCLCLYRSNRDDKWSFAEKAGVQQDFRDAVARGYRAPALPPPGPGPTPEPIPPRPTPPAPAPEPARRIDPRLVARGVHFTFAHPPAGTGYWRITEAEWLENAAQAVGPDHHILGRLLRDGAEVAGVKLQVNWPSGDALVVSKADDPNASYNYDYPMGPSLNEYGIKVAEAGTPSDAATGIGMGKGGNPREHTSTWITFEWSVAEAPDPGPGPTPEPPVVGGRLIWPVHGPITQSFGEGEARFGQAGHNGIDIAVALGTPVLCIADGVVAFTGFDEGGYGNYVRVYHAQLRSHSFVAHLSEIDVQVNQPVRQGDTLGESGSTGNSTGPHVHFELRAGDLHSYYEGITLGYTQGRYNPTDAYVVTGSALSPGGEA